MIFSSSNLRIAWRVGGGEGRGGERREERGKVICYGEMMKAKKRRERREEREEREERGESEKDLMEAVVQRLEIVLLCVPR